MCHGVIIPHFILYKDEMHFQLSRRFVEASESSLKRSFLFTFFLIVMVQDIGTFSKHPKMLTLYVIP